MRDKPLAYLETKRPPKTDSSLASSITQHWQTRHLYGKALIISERPHEIAKLIRKHWISAMQGFQQERSLTIDADRLLNLTHSITRMQQMVITADSPHEFPAAHLWIIQPDQLRQTELPRTCRTIYVHAKLEKSLTSHVQELLANHSLVVDYSQNTLWTLQDKHLLDEKVHHAWQELHTFLAQHNISISRLVKESHAIDLIDDALDTLLDTSSAFLRHARHFQEALHLAQPLQLSHHQKQEYELANLLVRRVTMLTPGLLHHSFIQPDNDTFSLYDAAGQKINRESLSAMISRHVAAGRKTLARALETAFVNNTLT